jgi:hypothetical protein
MSTEQDDRQVVLLTQEELEEVAKELPPDAVLIGGLARMRSVKGEDSGAGAEAIECKCTTSFYTSGHEIHMKEVCVADERKLIVTDTAVGSI